MLLMVIERFRQGDAKAVGARFKTSGRMLPAGVTYHASWMDMTGSCCFQIMEAPDPDALSAWVRCWDDLVEFEIVPVLASADFWARAKNES